MTLPTVEPLLKDGPLIDGYIYQQLAFRCKPKTIDMSKLYDITWYINGNPVAPAFTSLSGSTLPSSDLLESHWAANYNLGMLVSVGQNNYKNMQNINLHLYMPGFPNRKEVQSEYL